MTPDDKQWLYGFATRMRRAIKVLNIPHLPVPDLVHQALVLDDANLVVRDFLDVFLDHAENAVPVPPGTIRNLEELLESDGMFLSPSAAVVLRAAMAAEDRELRTQLRVLLEEHDARTQEGAGGDDDA